MELCACDEPGFRSCGCGVRHPGVSLEWRRHPSAQLRSRCCELTSRRPGFEVVTLCTGHVCPLRGSGLLSSRRKVHAGLLKKLSTAEFGTKGGRESINGLMVPSTGAMRHGTRAAQNQKRAGKVRRADSGSRRGAGNGKCRVAVLPVVGSIRPRIRPPP